MSILEKYYFYLFDSSSWKGEDIVEHESLHLAAKAANMNNADIDICLKLIDDSKIKSSLKKSTENAIEYGVRFVRYGWLLFRKILSTIKSSRKID